MSDIQTLRYYCTNELCHFEFKRVTNAEQTANMNCPTCGHPLTLEEV